jgi:formate hydrogenlyase subunit 6/NADH:ubiquinone oxidoreductase subunit I
MLRCIYCGFCEDACPTEAIVLGDHYELSFTDRRDAVYTKDTLLESVDSSDMTAAEGGTGCLYPLRPRDAGPAGLRVSDVY